jgi:fucose permease
MKNAGIKFSLYLNYFVFAILLNSVGIVILKSQKVYGVDEVQASTLELFKDMPIAIVSFLIASFLPRIGYKRAMLSALIFVTIASIAMYFGNSFWSAKMLFATVGVSFALIKVSVYSSIGLLTNNMEEHNSLMSKVEGFFMVGITLAFFLFPAFYSETNEDAWLRVYLVLAGISFISFLLLLSAKFEQNIDIPGANLAEDFMAMIKLFGKSLVLVFVIAAFLFVMIEQGIMTWLPTFNEEVLELPENIAVYMASILAISAAVGRISTGFLVAKFSWFHILITCLVLAAMTIIFILPRAVSADFGMVSSMKDIPLIGYAFPIVGLFLAPIYPLLNSVVLSGLPKNVHSHMAGLIIIFSALGGTLGSRLVGILFKNLGAESAFFYTLIPMAALFLSFFILRNITSKEESQRGIF